MSGRGRARGMRRGSHLKVMLNMQAASGHNFYSGNIEPPTIIRRGRGRGRGARGKRDSLLLDTDYIPPASRGRKKELLLLDTDNAGPVVNRKRKELPPFDSHDVTNAAPVSKRRRKVLRLESDDEFSDMDIGSLIPQSYNKGNFENQLSQVERCRLCDKPAVDSTSLSVCTSTTNIQMYQKLNKIVSADNLILKEKQGVLCSRCSRLLNYVDRIEVELSMLKKTIVECIHKKHNLYVPDESLNFDAVSGEETGMVEESVTMHENRAVKEKRTALSFARGTGRQMKNNNDFRDACSNSQLEDLLDSQGEDSYCLAENDDAAEIPRENTTEGGENSDVDIPAEYLEPMFEERVITVDKRQKQGQNVSGVHKEQSTITSDMEKSVSNSQGETDGINSNTKQSLDDVDVRSLIEELTADTQDEGDKPETQSSETQDDESVEAINVEEASVKEYWRDVDCQPKEVEAELSQNREETNSDIHTWKMSEELESYKSEVESDQLSNGSVHGSLKSNNTNQSEINNADMVNKEITSQQSKVICYDAGEWEDGDTQLPDKDDSSEQKKIIINFTEQKNEIDVEVVQKFSSENVIKEGKVDEPEEILFETKETKALIQAEKFPASVIEKSQVVMNTEHELEKTELENNEKEESKSSKTEITEIEETEDTEIEPAAIVGGVQGEQKTFLSESSKQEENDVDAEEIKPMHVVEKSDAEGERTDTCDEDEKLSDDEKMSVEIKWTTDSETEGTESNDEDVLKSEGKVTDDHTVTDVSNAETLEKCEAEETSVCNGDEVIVKSPEEVISEMQVDEDEGSLTSLNVDSNIQHEDIQQEIKKTFQECHTDLGEEESDHNIHKEDSTDAVQGHIQEDHKTETPVSNSETETKFSSLEQVEANTDRKQEEKPPNEEIQEEIKKQDKVNSIKDKQQDTQIPADEIEPEIEVLEFNKTDVSDSAEHVHKNSCPYVNQGAESSKIIPHEKPIADMIEEHLASILAEEPLSGEQGELFSMDVDSITNITEKSSVDVQGSNSIVTLQTEESVISMLEEPIASTQGNEMFTDVSDEKSVIIIDEDEETDHSQSAMLAGMGLIGQSTHGLPDLCGTVSDVECVDISSD